MDLVMLLAREEPSDTMKMVIGGTCVALVVLGMLFLAYTKK